MSRRLHWLLWLVTITLCPMILAAAYVVVLINSVSPLSERIQDLVVIASFTVAVFPFLAPLPKRGDVSRLEKHNFHTRLYRQIQGSFVILMVVVLCVDRIIFPTDPSVPAILSGILLSLIMAEFCRSLIAGYYVWRYARKEDDLYQYVQEHYYK